MHAHSWWWPACHHRAVKSPCSRSVTDLARYWPERLHSTARSRCHDTHPTGAPVCACCLTRQNLSLCQPSPAGRSDCCALPVHAAGRHFSVLLCIPQHAGQPSNRHDSPFSMPHAQAMCHSATRYGYYWDAVDCNGMLITGQYVDYWTAG